MWLLCLLCGWTNACEKRMYRRYDSARSLELRCICALHGWPLGMEAVYCTATMERYKTKLRDRLRMRAIRLWACRVLAWKCTFSRTLFLSFPYLNSLLQSLVPMNTLFISFSEHMQLESRIVDNALWLQFIRICAGGIMFIPSARPPQVCDV